jgi:hypothetical protein
VLYLYGIASGREPPEFLPRGFEDRTPAIAPYDGFAAITGWLEKGPPPATEAHLRKHFRVLEAFMASHTVLPARFGSTFAGPAELTAHLVLVRDTLAGDLQQLHGQIELGVRAAWLTAAASASHASAAFFAGTGPGARYLAEMRAKAAYRLDRQQAAQDLAGIVSAPLALHATQVEWRAIPAASGPAGVSMAFLLPREQLDAFRKALAALRIAWPSLDILCTGPWPPYSFVSGFDRTASRPNNLGDLFDAESTNRAVS